MFNARAVRRVCVTEPLHTRVSLLCTVDALLQNALWMLLTVFVCRDNNHNYVEVFHCDCNYGINILLLFAFLFLSRL